MSLLQPGQMIRDTYEVERYLAEGAFAEVYRVKHKFLGRQAMKVFKRTGMTNAELDEMMTEAVLLSRIAHPNIVQVFDANTVMTDDGERILYNGECSRRESGQILAIAWDATDSCRNDSGHSQAGLSWAESGTQQRSADYPP